MDYALALRSIFATDPVRLHVLSLVRSLQLPDCWVGAGFLRNAVWDHLHGRSAGPLSDVDVIWFDPARRDPSEDQELEARLKALDASLDWDVKNQSRMHLRNGGPPYASTEDALRYYPEMATAVAVRQTMHGNLEFAAPFGFDDLFALVVRPTPRFHEKRPVYLERIQKKAWLNTWPLLRIEQ